MSVPIKRDFQTLLPRKHWRRATLSRSVLSVLTAATAFLAVIGTTPTLAQQDDLFEREELTGDWGGERTRLENAGITPALNYTADPAANPVGGERQGADYAGVLYGSTRFDFEKLFGARGWSALVSASWAHGRDLSSDTIGNFFIVQEVFSGRTFRLSELYVEKSLFDKKLDIAAGRIAIGDDFGTMKPFTYYMNAGVGHHALTIIENVPGWTTLPDTQWGARGHLDLQNGFQLTVGTYNADPSVKDASNGGLDFSFRPGLGVLTFAQASYSWNRTPSGNALPGEIILGGFGDSSKYAALADSSDETYGNYGFYAFGHQQLTREAASVNQGLTGWAAVTVTPDQTINEVPIGLFGGLIYQGLFPGRDEDSTAFGLFYTAFSEDLEDQNFEIAMELNHRFQIAPWLYVMPSAQYIINPNGQSDIHDAGVIGFELSIDF
ncbi:carbohydrate porin [Roseibium sp. RKSG952]|uniref:carbohydrate porin n=1 Tax=Roseibium sp. RKSG952 TaxID=2529384 RepID=UPI0012BC7CDD|nr:carbohydrate porin [Roseibium sp. RKSG952]MTH97914.1 carbohydrate porin [Roseibium sp. RKSG952]